MNFFKLFHFKVFNWPIKIVCIQGVQQDLMSHHGYQKPVSTHHHLCGRNHASQEPVHLVSESSYLLRLPQIPSPWQPPQYPLRLWFWLLWIPHTIPWRPLAGRSWAGVVGGSGVGAFPPSLGSLCVPGCALTCEVGKWHTDFWKHWAAKFPPLQA